MRPWLPHNRRDLIFSRGNCLYKEGQKCACPEQTEKKPAHLCYLHNSTNGKVGLVRFQISMLAKRVEKHRDKLHTRSLLWLLSQHCQNMEHGEKSSKAQLPKVVAASSLTLLARCLCMGEGRHRGKEDAAACGGKYHSVMSSSVTSVLAGKRQRDKTRPFSMDMSSSHT